jgi:hypothetical protein
MCDGAQDTDIWKIISRNTIHRRITKECAKYKYTRASNL